MLGVGLGPQVYNTAEAALSCAPKAMNRKAANGMSGFEKSDLLLDMFLVQHDMENMHMWVFKERTENALGKDAAEELHIG
jgi:hypothetical protein